jgi:two-component system phosphate regulon sensor histidine kinase PhoR
MGIARDELPRIFDRFYRVDGARNTDQGGTGLGLAIVKRIVELHSGQIQVDSEPGSGSTFCINLPTAPHPDA